MTISKVKGTWSKPTIIHNCKILDESSDKIIREWNPWHVENEGYWDWTYVLSTGCDQDEHSFDVIFCPHCGVNLYDEQKASETPAEETK